MENQEFKKMPRRILAHAEMDLVLVERDLNSVNLILKNAGESLKKQAD
jgi:hypothetical protein